MKEDITITELEHLALQNQIKSLKINITSKFNNIMIAVNNKPASDTATNLWAIQLTLKT